MTMRALLLAAGLGSRLRPLTDTIPKCLVPIAGKPLLDYWFDMLHAAGVREILVNLHYHHEKVIEHIRRRQDKEGIETVYEKDLLGTGGTLLKNRNFFRDDPLMLVHADNLSAFDVTAFLNAHASRPAGSLITMMTFRTDIPETCGIVELDSDNRVIAFHEKVKNPPGNLANGAVYIIEPVIMDFLSSLKKEFIDFSTEVLPHYLGKIYTYENKIYHRDIGNPESYAQAQREWIELGLSNRSNI